MNSIVTLIGIYDFNKDFLLIEMLVDEFTDKVDIESFCIPNSQLDKSQWQVAYMEQYLNIEGTTKLCDTYSIPTAQTKPSRIVFFICKTDDLLLSSSYGEFSLANPQKLPNRLVNIIDFDECD